MTEYGSVLDGYIVPGEPLVSVNVITYNHGKYIRQCLDGILMQKVNFPYEVLVHDDASPDDTADIIREYEARFPTVIKPIYQTENQYSQGKSVGKFNIDRAKGKYIAQCEGDDYWTDPEKLQMQVDFLEGHEEYVGCVHRVKVINETGMDDLASPFASCYTPSVFTLQDAQKYDVCWGLAGHWAALIYRNIFKTCSKEIVDNYYACKTNGDNKLSLFLALNGDIYRFDETMSTYRHITTFGTSWSTRCKTMPNPYWRHYSQICELERFAKENYGFSLDYNLLKVSCGFGSLLSFLKRPKIIKLKEIYMILSTYNLKLFYLFVYYPLHRYPLLRLAQKIACDC